MKKLTVKTEKQDELSELERGRKELEWEGNHAKIASAILEHLQQYGTMPSKTCIAHAAGLSRLTVHRHLESFNDNETFNSERKSFGVMRHHVISQMLRAAMNGDLRAAKMFLEADARLNAPAKADIKNYIQINKTVINQQIIQQLKPEQLNRIEEIITQGLDEKTALG